MLRCAACGATVSEWAPHCPDCRHGTQDAVRQPDAPTAAPPRAATPQRVLPPPGPARPDDAAVRRQGSGRVAATLTVVAVLAALAVAAVAIRWGRSQDRVLAGTTAGTVVTARPDGSHETAVAAPSGGLVVAVDGRYLSSSDGRELVWRGDRLLPTGRRAPLGPRIDGARLGQFTPTWQATDFADHDRALVAVRDGGNGLLDAEVVSFTDRRLTIGPVVSAAGDPATLGAVTVQGSPEAVVLVDAGHRSHVLLNAGRASRLLGLPEAVGVALVALPDRSGNRIAVLAVPLDPVHDVLLWPSGIIVVSRSGQVLGVRPQATLGMPAWSADGTTLVYPIPEVARRDGVALWKIGAGHSQVLPYTHRGPPLTGCVWATSGDAFLCSASEPNPSVPWVSGRVGDRRLRGGSGPPTPLLYRS